MDELRQQLQIVPEARMTYRSQKYRDRPITRTSTDAADLLRPLFLEEMEMREAFRVLMLDRGNRAKCIYTASIGGLHGTVVDPKLVFAAALGCLASSVVVAHNHPSGQLRPSEEDIALTRKLVAAGRVLDITVFDHIILTTEGHFSFADSGML